MSLSIINPYVFGAAAGSSPVVTITSGTTSPTSAYDLKGTVTDDGTIVSLEYEVDSGGALPIVTPVPVTALPGLGDGTFGWNGAAHAQDMLTTAGGYQYAAWVATGKKQVIAQRSLPDGSWVFFDLSTITGNPLGTIADDGHNTVNVAVDSDGYIHLAANHHNSALRYVRSDNPHDISAWTAIGMIGTEETSVTYPQFLTLPTGELLLFYRDGTSGNGDLILNEYDTVSETWARIAKVIDGKSSSDSPYPQHIAVDWDTGTIHLFFTWRDTGDADDTNDLCYAKSSDGGATWTNSVSSAYTLPITHATAEKVVDTADSGSGLINQMGADVDSSGNPHTVIWLDDFNGYRQMHHVYWNGSAWQNEQVTAWTSASPTGVGADYARPTLFTVGDRVFVFYVNHIEHPGQVRGLEITPGITPVEFLVMDRDVSEQEWTFDTRALKEREELNIIICPMVRATPSNGRDVYWDDQPIDLLTIFLDEIDEYVEGRKVVL